jgi:hypothetical protein
VNKKQAKGKDGTGIQGDKDNVMEATKYESLEVSFYSCCVCCDFCHVDGGGSACARASSKSFSKSSLRAPVSRSNDTKAMTTINEIQREHNNMILYCCNDGRRQHNKYNSKSRLYSKKKRMEFESCNKF